MTRIHDFTNEQPFGTFKDGRPVTEADIAKWADEAENGHNFSSDARRGGRPSLSGDGAPSSIVPVRLDQALADALNARASNDHTTKSEVIRAALRAWLAA